jgi:hypothetical protein
MQVAMFVEEGLCGHSRQEHKLVNYLEAWVMWYTFPTTTVAANSVKGP